MMSCLWHLKNCLKIVLMEFMSRLVSVILSNVMGSLPVTQATSFFNGGGPGSTGQLTTNDEFYSWLNDTVIRTMFQDAVCGDGVCSSPEEVPAVGRFGW